MTDHNDARVLHAAASLKRAQQRVYAEEIVLQNIEHMRDCAGQRLFEARRAYAEARRELIEASGGQVPVWDRPRAETAE